MSRSLCGSLGPLSWYLDPAVRGGWVRLFGPGLWFASAARHRPLFSERVGAVKVRRVGPVVFRWLAAGGS